MEMLAEASAPRTVRHLSTGGLHVQGSQAQELLCSIHLVPRRPGPFFLFFSLLLPFLPFSSSFFLISVLPFFWLFRSPTPLRHQRPLPAGRGIAAPPTLREPDTFICPSSLSPCKEREEAFRSSRRKEISGWGGGECNFPKA